MLLSFFRSSGKVARPDCLSMFDFDGAVSSLSTVHFGSPLPVRVAAQPSGVAPIWLLSKLTLLSDMSFTSIEKSVAALVPSGVGMARRLGSSEIENSRVQRREDVKPIRL